MIDDAPVVFDAAAIEAAVARVASAVTGDLSRRDPLILCVLAGAVPFAAALVTRLGFPLELDFIKVSRYRDGARGGGLEWILEPSVAVRDRHVLIVEDVLDHGETLSAIRSRLVAEGAASVRDAVLVVKSSSRRPAGLVPSYHGLVADSRFLVGFGMDHAGRYRNLPDIRALPEVDA